MSDTSPSLVIRMLRVTNESGGLALSVEPKNGINVIRGANSSGRSTFLQLMEFGLGATWPVSRFIPEIKHCKRLLLEVELNEVPYTIERKFHGAQQVEVYQGRIDDALHEYPTVFAAGSEFSNFLLHKLNIPRISYVDPFTERENAITFEDIYDSLFLDQERGFSEIHARLSKPKRPNVFKLLTNTVVPDLYSAQLDEMGLRKQLEKLEQEIAAIARFLGDIDLPTPVIIEIRTNELRERRSKLNEQIDRVKRELLARPDYSSPLRTELLTLESALDEKQHDLRFARQTLQDYVELENQLVADQDRVARSRSAAHLLSSFEFEQCPRCLQAMDADMKRREADGRCSLCNRTILRNSDQIDDLIAYEKQISYQLDELKDLEGHYQDSIQGIEEHIERLLAQVNSVRQQLDEASRQFVSPAISDIESLGYQVATIDQELANLEDLRGWHARLDQMKDKGRETRDELATVKQRKSELEERERDLQGRLHLFEGLFHSFVRDIYPGFEAARLNYNTFLPEINDHDYRAKSATQRDIAILGYYYALLRFSLETSSNIPRFLVIDTLRRDDLAEELHRELLLKFKDLETNYGEGFQLFLVVRDKLDFLVDDEILQLVDGGLLLQL